MYALKNMRSRHFSITRNKDTITLEGRGFGHHMGLCQFGMTSMVKKGYAAGSILNYYYPGTTLAHLNNIA